MSMAASVEARVPMLDLDLMTLAESIPATAKLGGHTPKYLLKSALIDIVPDDVLRRPKLGFEVPMEAWIRNGLAASVRDLLFRRGGLVGTVFRPEAVEQLLRTHMEGRENRWREIFLLVSLEILRSVFRSSEWQSHTRKEPDLPNVRVGS
jgi:asparagine synthase (glutamine-hydrolysing)